jgi:hypothetical protein
MMDEASITQYIAETFDGVDVLVASQANGAPEVAWGDTFFSYDPDGQLPAERRFPFATIVTKDYPGFDCKSQLNRPGVFRLNIGLSKETYRSLFGSDAGGHDFAALDRVLPHPVYASQSWVCVLNPSEATFEQQVQPLLADAYARAVRQHAKGARER